MRSRAQGSSLRHEARSSIAQSVRLAERAVETSDSKLLTAAVQELREARQGVRALVRRGSGTDNLTLRLRRAADVVDGAAATIHAQLQRQAVEPAVPAVPAAPATEAVAAPPSAAPTTGTAADSDGSAIRTGPTSVLIQAGDLLAGLPALTPAPSSGGTGAFAGPRGAAAGEALTANEPRRGRGRRSGKRRRGAQGERAENRKSEHKRLDLKRTGGSSLDQLKKLAASFGLEDKINSTTGGEHAPRSLHYSARAIDISENSGLERGAKGKKLAAYAKANPEQFTEFFGPMDWYIKDGKVVNKQFPDHGDHYHVAI